MCVCVRVMKCRDRDSFLARRQYFFQLIQVTPIPSVFLSLLLLSYQTVQRCPFSPSIIENLKKGYITEPFMCVYISGFQTFPVRGSPKIG